MNTYLVEYCVDKDVRSTKVEADHVDINEHLGWLLFSKRNPYSLLSVFTDPVRVQLIPEEGRED